MNNYMKDMLNKYSKNKCWHPKGCRFNSNNSQGYMKCWKKDYSIEQCKKDYEDSPR